MADYALRVYDAAGGYLANLDVVARLELAQPANDVGTSVLSLPILYPFDLFQKDGLIVVDRTVRGVTLPTTWLVRKPERTLAESGEKRIGVTAFDPRDLLRRRIVPVVSQATKTGPADDLMKAIVREQFVSASDTARNLGSLFSVAADTSDAPGITVEFANRVVLDVLRDIAAVSAAAGTYLAFDVVPIGSSFEFRTYTDVWGTDRRSSILLSAEMGTLANVSVSNDWTEEVTAVYASGRGEGTAALTAVAADAVRIARSPFGRIESYLNASNATTVAALQSAVNAELQAGRPREQFSARLVEQPGTRYGVDLYLGDLVTVEHEGTRYDCRVEPVRIVLDEDGSESVDIQLRNIA